MQIKKLLHNKRYEANRLLGIDIRANSICLIELSYSERCYKVELCINAPIMRDFSILLRTEQRTLKTMPNYEENKHLFGFHPADVISSTLKKILEENQVKTKSAAISISHSAVIFKDIEVDCSLTDKEIENFVQFNTRRHINGLASGVSFDYHIVNIPKKLIGHKMLRVVMTQDELIEKYIKILHKVGLHPKIVDIDTYALERTVRRQFNDVIELTAIISINYESILIMIIDCEKIVYIHEEFVNEEELQSISQIISHLKTNLQLVFSSLSKPLEKIVLVGEKANFLGLSEEISVQFNIQTVIIDPFLNMKLSLAVARLLIEKMSPIMAISCGLALRVGHN